MINARSTFNLIYALSQFFLGLSFFALISLDANAEASKVFMMKDLVGKEHRLSDYQGKWVLVNYWATWCPSCLDEIPDLVSLYDQHKNKDLVVLGIAVDYKSEHEVRHFVDDMLISYPIILGTPKIFAQFGSSSVLPTTYIYNPQGKLVKIKRGQLSKQTVESIMLASPTELLDINAP
jgi:thiol-disulfide isomerase/thioredoxin